MKKAIIFVSAFMMLTMATSLWTAVSVQAGPGSPWPIEVEQPDGSTLTVFTRGDEFQGWVETDDGFTVVQDKDTGAWEYAEEGEDGKLKSTGIKASRGETPPSHIKPHLKPPRDVEAEKEFGKMLKKIKEEHKSKDNK